jgi:hypothetical protein
MKVLSFQQFGGMCTYVGYRAYVEFCYWVAIWELGRRMRAASDLFIGRYVCYFIRPAWQQVYVEAF